MQYTVIIRKEHCQGNKYGSNDDCGLCRAIKEQLPSLPLRNVGGTTVWTNEGLFKITSDWGFHRFLEIQTGELDNYPVTFASPKLDPVIEAQSIINEEVPV